MSDKKKKGTTRCAVDLPDNLNKRMMNLLSQKHPTGRVPKNKRALVLECAKIGFEQLVDEARGVR